jgi:UDP-N-acetylglucosamine 2-epimerase
VKEFPAIVREISRAQEVRVETVQEGWNLLVNPSDNAIASRIADFVTSDVQNGAFGNNVTEKMVQIINSLN